LAQLLITSVVHFRALVKVTNRSILGFGTIDQTKLRKLWYIEHGSYKLRTSIVYFDVLLSFLVFYWEKK